MLLIKIFGYKIGIQYFDASLTDWTSIYSLIGSLSIILLIFTIKEMIKQRRESYHPKLLIQTEPIQFETNNNNMPTVWRNPLDRERVTGDHFNLRLYNIGLGPATEIEIIWLLPKGKIIRDFKKYSPNLLSEKKIISKTPQGEFEFELFQKDELDRRRKEFLTNGESFYFSLPRSVFYYFSFIAHSQCLDNLKIEQQIILTPMEIIIKYKDIGNKKIQKHYYIRPYLRSNNKSKKKFAIGDIHALEINIFERIKNVSF